jgi:DNA mismatch endonuclease, patch repair protein
MLKRQASYKGLRAASQEASARASASSLKSGTRCELVLRRELTKRGLRYRVDVASLPGRPDIVFHKARLVVFCDGDFWHGRDLRRRLARLQAGHNAGYWMAKIQRNVDRDRAQVRSLRADGWTVVRLWESDIHRDVGRAADKVLKVLIKPLRQRKRLSG